MSIEPNKNSTDSIKDIHAKVDIFLHLLASWIAEELNTMDTNS